MTTWTGRPAGGPGSEAVKAAHIPKVERRLAVAVATLLPESTSRGDVEAPGDRLRRLLARLDSAEFEGKGRPESGWRSAVRDIVELLDNDVPELIDAVRQAQGAQRKYCRYCGERRLGLLAASNDDHHTWECRDEDGCQARIDRKPASDLT
jgi:hypothetical protein